ncbi:MAG: hypothetical protein WDW38_002389 [Sanguina aurantia]
MTEHGAVCAAGRCAARDRTGSCEVRAGGVTKEPRRSVPENSPEYHVQSCASFPELAPSAVSPAASSCSVIAAMRYPRCDR